MTDTAPGNNLRTRRPVAGIPTSFPTTVPIVPGAASARVVTIADDGLIMVSIADQMPVVALIAQHVSADQIRKAHAAATPVLVVAVDGDPQRLVIIGILMSTIHEPCRPPVATIDGRRVELTGRDEVILTCGKASIILTRAGKVIIKGTYISSGAEGTHRITGGSVQIN